ncbi:MAG: hypothetical protein OD817_02360 [Gammaproteobacteria bacterium]
MRRAFSPFMGSAAIVCATLAAVAVVCSHNHAHALPVAAGLAATGVMLAILQRRRAAHPR